MSSTSYVDFYKKHQICPVINDVDPKYLKQREALYIQLGIIPSLVKDKTVIEFGPGNGINSLYTQSLGPKKYLLVDGNPTSLENCKNHFEKSFPGDSSYEFKEALFDDFKAKEKYDLAICEGFIPHQHHPTACAKNLASFTKVGGLFVTTCHDHISNFSEMLRSFISYVSVGSDQSFEQKVDSITDLLEDHFSTLKAMNRKKRDWVIDNIMQVDHWKSTPLFSIDDAIETFKENFLFFGSSPNFLSDWRWYKDLVKEDELLFNAYIQEKYWKNAHNFIDYRTTFPERKVKENQKLYQMAKDARKLISNCIDHDKDEFKLGLITHLKEMKEQVESFSKMTANSLECYIKNLEHVFNSMPIKFSHFQKWWGRGMQFLSLLRVG